ncbi:hypothetical protein H6P81_010959 [Aristolochia fimbriata]|uniref:Uncharacterized protein n=1 Tax=Aristolochia fimbriata TaxID=158543 RepID=A0AAV7EQX1_ARIFI|nr:hypothetical protein H6P81_010959 [Aristolochia fimbriata]
MSQNRSAKVKQLWREKKEGQASVENAEAAEKKEVESFFKEDNCSRLFDPERVALCEDDALLTKVFKEFGPKRRNRLPVFNEICKEDDE